jgi:dephospho-CoA kinase
MLKVGLTGGLASGKTFVAAVLEQLGCRVVSSDRLGHEAIRRDGESFARVIEEFGNGILGADGEIDRSRLGKIVFSDEAKLKKLSSLVHPYVLKKQESIFAQITAQDSGSIVVCEAAIMIETGSYSRYDRIVVAVCPPELQVRRYCAREGVSMTDALARLALQIPIEEKRKYADYVIDTAGTKQETKRQVRAVHQELLQQVVP